MIPTFALARPDSLLRRAFAPAKAPRSEARRLWFATRRLATCRRPSRWLRQALKVTTALRSGPLMGRALERVTGQPRPQAAAPRDARHPRLPMKPRRTAPSVREGPAASTAPPANPRSPFAAAAAPAIHDLPHSLPGSVLNRFCPPALQPAGDRRTAAKTVWPATTAAVRRTPPAPGALASWRQDIAAAIAQQLNRTDEPGRDPAAVSSLSLRGLWASDLAGPAVERRLLIELASGVAAPSTDRHSPPAAADGGMSTASRHAPVLADTPRSTAGAPPQAVAGPAAPGGRAAAAGSAAPRPGTTAQPATGPNIGAMAPSAETAAPAFLDPPDANPRDPADPLFSLAGIDLDPPSQLAPRLPTAPQEQVALPGPARDDTDPEEPGSAPSHAPRSGRAVTDNHELAERVSRILRDEARRHGIDV